MSDISFAIAKIGGGKSRFAAEQVCRELERSDRMIVTNLATWLYEAPDMGHMSLADWCWKYVPRGIDIGKRVRVLKRGEVRDFYMHYPGFDLSLCNDEGEFAGYDVKPGGGQLLPNLAERQRLQQASKIPMGCLFVLDEVHLYFGSREWQKCGPGVIHYMSQLRKLNDDVLLITQHEGKVDKNFRRDATEWIYFENMGRRRLWGGVSFAGTVRFQVFLKEPEKGDEPERTGSYKIVAREYEKVYDTMAGVGLAGRLIPEQKEKRGGHWSRWIVIGAVIIIASIIFPSLVMKWAGRATRSAVSGFSQGMAGKIVTGVPAASSVVSAEPRIQRAVGADAPAHVERKAALAMANEKPAGPGKSDLEVSASVFYVGWVGDGVQRKFFLTDGSDFHLGDGHLQTVGRNFIVADGVKYLEKENPEAEGASGSVRGGYPAYHAPARRS